MTAEAQQVSALEKLEGRILDMVEQLKESRRRQLAAEEEAAALRKQLAAKEQELEQLQSQTSDAAGERDEVRRRIEGLLDRIDSME